MTTYVLVGTSPTDATRRHQLRSLADRLDAELAFLQLATPSLITVLDRLADAGTSRVVLVPVAGGHNGPGVSWVRRIAAHWWQAYGAGAPEVCTTPRVLTDEASFDELVEQARPITRGGPGLTSPAWEDVPRHRRQVLVCRGPRCTASGAEDTWVALVLALMRHDLGDDDVLVTHTGCQLPCNHAPVMSVQPDDVWYGAVDASAADEIVAGHLAVGQPVERVRLPRRTPITEGSASQ